jgi:outer membrane protein assembly factor BamB
MKTMISLAVLVAVGPGAGRADDWPQWMGPGRDSIWKEEGVAKKFPEGGPKIAWRVPVNWGYGGPAVAHGKVYLMDYLIESGKVVNNPGKAIALKGKERTLCLDAKTGEMAWQHVAAIDYELSYPGGPRCTPTVADGKVYALGGMGHLTCLDAKTGKLVWERDLPKKYGAAVSIWGHSGHPLVHGDTVYSLAGGEGSVVVALDKDTGEEKWKALTANEPGYAPPTLIKHAGVEQLLIWTPKNLHALNPINGKEYWSKPLAPDYNMSIMAPQKSGDKLYAAGIGYKGFLLKLHDDKPGADVLWRGTPKTGLYCATSTPVIVDGIMYGDDIRSSSLVAVDLKDGTRLWTTREPTVGGEDDGSHVNNGTVFLVYHEGNKLFYLFNERGDLIIAELTPGGYREISRAHILEPTNEAFGREVVWTMPAFADQAAFVRNDKELVRVELSGE